VVAGWSSHQILLQALKNLAPHTGFVGLAERGRRAMVLIDASLEREKKKNYWNYLMGKMR
jgi:hypothetical protein